MNFRDIAEQFNININDPQLFLDAFTHSSYSNEKKCNDYEKIEFIGDGVLDLIIADLTYHAYPTLRQGELTKMRSFLVCSASLANYARKYHFEKAIRIGQGELHAGGPNQKILEDVFEAFIGAVYLDQGFEFVKKLIINIFEDDIKNFNFDNLTDYKSKLQEDLQSNHRGNIVYHVISEKGTAQDKMFTVEVKMILEDKSEIRLGQGSGKKKKIAEENAAKDAISTKAG